MCEQRELLVAIGELKAALRGLREQASHNHTSLMQRMDDLDKAAHQRIDGVEGRVVVLERDNKHHYKQAGWGGAGGALVAGLIEIAKHVK